MFTFPCGIGSTALSGEEIAGAVSQIWGEKFSYVPAKDEDLHKHLVSEVKMPAWQAAGVTELFRQWRDGQMGVTEDVKTILETDPTNPADTLHALRPVYDSVSA